jgi:hypothetical protein
MSDHEEAAMRHAREVKAMSDEEVALELEAAGIDVEQVRARFHAMRTSPPKATQTRRTRIVFLAAAAVLFAALLAIVLVSLSDTPPPIAPIPYREPTPIRFVERHQDLVAPDGDAGQVSVPTAPRP